MLSKRIMNIAPSATLAIDSKAKQMKKDGRCRHIRRRRADFNTPENIKQAAIKSIENNFTRYTSSGIPELKKAVAEKLKRDMGFMMHLKYK